MLDCRFAGGWPLPCENCASEQFMRSTEREKAAHVHGEFIYKDFHTCCRCDRVCIPLHSDGVCTNDVCLHLGIWIRTPLTNPSRADVNHQRKRLWRRYRGQQCKQRDLLSKGCVDVGLLLNADASSNIALATSTPTTAHTDATMHTIPTGSTTASTISPLAAARTDATRPTASRPAAAGVLAGTTQPEASTSNHAAQPGNGHGQAKRKFAVQVCLFFLLQPEHGHISCLDQVSLCLPQQVFESRGWH